MTPEAAAGLLNVSLSATRDEILAAHALRSRMTHPDRFAGAPSSEISAAAAEFIRVSEARDVLLEALAHRLAKPGPDATKAHPRQNQPRASSASGPRRPPAPPPPSKFGKAQSGHGPTFSTKSKVIIGASITGMLAIIISMAALSLPTTVQVPPVLGTTRFEAIDAIHAVGLTPDVSSQFADQQADVVIGVNPSEGTKLHPGDTVRILVSNGPEVPSANSEERAACAYVRTMYDNLPPASTQAEAESSLNKVAGMLVSHAGAVYKNHALSAVLNDLATQIAVTVDFMKATGQVLNSATVGLEQIRQNALSICKDLGI